MPTFTQVAEEVRRLCELTGRTPDEVLATLSLLEDPPQHKETNGYHHQPTTRDFINDLSCVALPGDNEAKKHLLGATIFKYLDYYKDTENVGFEVNAAHYCLVTGRAYPVRVLGKGEIGKAERREMTNTFRHASGLESVYSENGHQKLIPSLLVPVFKITEIKSKTVKLASVPPRLRSDIIKISN
jgi:hypothetical protein